MSKPIAICVSEIADVFDWGLVTVPFELLARLLPGPVTLFFERKPELNTEFNPSKHHFIILIILSLKVYVQRGFEMQTNPNTVKIQLMNIISMQMVEMCQILDIKISLWML